MFFIKSWFSSWTALGTLLGPSRHPLGTLLGLSWGALGRSWTLLGHFPAAPGRLKSAQEAAGVRTGRAKKRKKNGFFPLLLLLGRSWPCLGLSWPHLGTSRAHLEGSWAVFWFPHGLPREIPTTVPGKVVIPGFQERPWESLLAFGH